MNALLVATSSTEDDDIGDFLDAVLVELLEVSKSLTTSDSEKHLAHAVLLVVLNGSSDKLESAIHKRFARARILSITVGLHWDSSLKVRDELLDEVDDHVVVLQLKDVALDLSNGLTLSLDE